MKARLCTAIFICLIALGTASGEQSPAQTQTKPYGCFRDLRWGMTFEQAQDSLGIKLKKYPKIKGAFTAYSKIKIGDYDYSILLGFVEEKGLIIVSIYPWEARIGASGAGLGCFSEECLESQVNILIQRYALFKKALEEKFGKPVGAVENNPDLWRGTVIIQKKPLLQSIWKTEESLITLQVNPLTVTDFHNGDLAVEWWPLLTYQVPPPPTQPESKPDI